MPQENERQADGCQVIAGNVCVCVFFVEWTQQLVSEVQKHVSDESWVVRCIKQVVKVRSMIGAKEVFM